MTRDDIERWVEECVITTGPRSPYFDIDAFAKLVAAAEREACAKVAERTVCDTHLDTGIKVYGTRAAAAIRARGNT